MRYAGEHCGHDIWEDSELTGGFFIANDEGEVDFEGDSWPSAEDAKAEINSWA